MSMSATTRVRRLLPLQLHCAAQTVPPLFIPNSQADVRPVLHGDGSIDLVSDVDLMFRPGLPTVDHIEQRTPDPLWPLPSGKKVCSCTTRLQGLVKAALL